MNECEPLGCTVTRPASRRRIPVAPWPSRETSSSQSACGEPSSAPTPSAPAETAVEGRLAARLAVCGLFDVRVRVF
jgi:hypothetical protein